MRCGRPLSIECQQAGEDLLVGCRLGLEIVPPVCGPDGAVEGGVGMGQPGGAGVVEVGEGPLLQLGFARVRRVEPLLAQLVQLARRIRDGVQPCSMFRGTRFGRVRVPCPLGLCRIKMSCADGGEGFTALR